MSTITSIKQQKNKDRVNVYLDGKFGFGIDLTNFVLMHLKVDQELTDKKVTEIVKKAEFQKTLDKLLRFATVRPRSEKEIREYFRRKKVHASLHEDLFKKLKYFKLVDDAKFARWWIDQRQSFRPKPERVLVQELRLKGVDSQIIKDVLERTEVDEEKLAKSLIEKRAYKWKNMTLQVRRQRISQYLLQRGFSWEVVRKVI